MDTSKKPWPLNTVFGIRKRINTQPDYQRPPVWSTSQKQLLIDTILRNYDIPKLYWRKTGKQPDTYDVVDGQQRLLALWGFTAGDYKLPPDLEPVEGMAIAGLGYGDLPDDLRMRFDTYPLDVVLVEAADEDEVREMFLRLQNGTSLKAQERRNAYKGKMRDFVRGLTKHAFFSRVGFADSRYTFDLVAAQMVCLELKGGPTNVKNADLNRMYLDNITFNEKGDTAASVRRVLDLLAVVFPETTPELTRFNVISLYCMLAELTAKYVKKEFQPRLHKWFLEFEGTRKKHEALSEEDAGADPEWMGYKEKISHSTDSEESIQWRTEFMLRHFLQANPGLHLKDDQRQFTHEQRLAVFRRDGGICQLHLKCDGVKVVWNEWHCDHKKAWSKGGRTTVENGQVACCPCNLAKGGDD